jgi:signal transduction histidine kinase
MPNAETFSGVPLPPARVLVVDDTPANRLAVGALLEGLGIELVEAGSGSEAMTAIERAQFALVLLDVQMPGMDGFQTLELIRRRGYGQLPVLFLTGFDASRAMRARAFALGAFDFLTKPLDAEELRGKVNAFLASHNRGRELERQAEALRAKDRFLGMLAHDLRTPIAVVVYAARLLADESSPHIRTSAARIERAAVRMEHLTRDLLDYARAAAHRIPLRLRTFDLAALCWELVDDFAASAPNTHFSLGAPDALVGTWDGERLHQAIANLLSNAAKYGDGAVRMTVKQNGDEVTVSVLNGGKGIAPEHLERVFEPFQQENHGSPGVGLGLYIVREIVAAHGGRTVARSASEQTTFELHLPLNTSRQTHP